MPPTQSCRNEFEEASPLSAGKNRARPAGHREEHAIGRRNGLEIAPPERKANLDVIAEPRGEREQRLFLEASPAERRLALNHQENGLGFVRGGKQTPQNR